MDEPDEEEVLVRDLEPEDCRRLSDIVPFGSKAKEQLQRENVVVTEDFISKGSFGEVFHGHFEGQRSAVKVIYVDRLRRKNRDYVEKQFPRELQVIKRLNHPNIVTTFCIYRQSANDRVYLFMEFASRGTLKEYVSSPWRFGRKPSEREVKELIEQVAKGLEYMHSLNWCHRDVKAENCLVFGWIKRVVKLTDFSFSRNVLDPVDGSRTRSGTYVGTIYYRAPELLREEPYDPLTADVWSLGVLLFFLMSGDLPFVNPFRGKSTYSANIQEVIEQQEGKRFLWDPESEAKASDQVKELISAMLEPKVGDRLTIEEVVDHDWFLPPVSRSFTASLSKYKFW